MHKNGLKLAFAALIGLGLAAAAPGEQPTTMPDWMAGGWEQRNGELWVDEYWTPPRGGLMSGASRTGKDAKLMFWEQSRIERKSDGTLSYFAMPKGAPATEFKQAKSGPRVIEFVNLQHDYPQRIRYWREGNALKAEVSLSDGTKAETWTYRPLR